MPWISTADRLPPIRRWVKVWGSQCMDGFAAPKAYRRLETPGYPHWFWCSPEHRGTSGIGWWWEDEEGDGHAPTTPPPDRAWRPMAGPGDGGYEPFGEDGAPLVEVPKDD
jgi:hypothetical protein